MKKDETSENFIIEFFSNYLNTQNIIFNNFWYFETLIFEMVKLKKILNIPSYSNFRNYSKLEIFAILYIKISEIL